MVCLVGCSSAVVASTHRKLCMSGETTSLRLAACRPRRIDFKCELELLHIISHDQKVATVEIANSYNSRDSDSASQYTLPRAELRIGLRSWPPKYVPQLTARHHQQRLQRGEYWNWIIKRWKKAAWSDESRFLIHQIDRPL